MSKSFALTLTSISSETSSPIYLRPQTMTRATPCIRNVKPAHKHPHKRARKHTRAHIHISDVRPTKLANCCLSACVLERETESGPTLPSTARSRIQISLRTSRRDSAHLSRTARAWLGPTVALTCEAIGCSRFLSTVQRGKPRSFRLLRKRTGSRSTSL